MLYIAVSSKRIVKVLAINVLPTALDRLEYRRENRKGQVTLHLEGTDKRRSSHEVWRKSGTWLGLMLLLSVLSGCNVTESTFARTASNAGSAFAAAATTLTYAHEDKITYAYAASSFVNFQSGLSGIDQALTAPSAVDTRTLHHLLTLYKPAIQVINAPCLSGACNWRSQIEVLNRVSQALLKAGNS